MLMMMKSESEHAGIVVRVGRCLLANLFLLRQAHAVDDHARLTVEWRAGAWALWGGAFTASRDVRWRLAEGDALDTARDSDGTVFGVSWSKGDFSASAEYESGSFDRFVFRTDPETVDRLTVRLRAGLAKIDAWPREHWSSLRRDGFATA